MVSCRLLISEVHVKSQEIMVDKTALVSLRALWFSPVIVILLSTVLERYMQSQPPPPLKKKTFNGRKILLKM
jgi:hypothetical protein